VNGPAWVGSLSHPSPGVLGHADGIQSMPRASPGARGAYLIGEPVGRAGDSTAIVNAQNRPGADLILVGQHPPEVAQLDAGHVHGSRMCAIPPYKSARNVSAIAFTGPGGSTKRSAEALTDGASRVVRSSVASSTGGPTWGQVATTSPSVIVWVGPGIAASWRASKSMPYSVCQRSTAARPKARCLISASGNRTGRASSVSLLGIKRAPGTYRGLSRRTMALERIASLHEGPTDTE
jgi:hypothetical protein